LILQNYFRKLSFFENNFVKKFYYTKNLCNVTHNFCCCGLEILAVVATGWGGGGELEVHLNLMLPRVTKVGLFSLFWTFRAASH
jgi:hypothetical protein